MLSSEDKRAHNGAGLYFTLDGQSGQLLATFWAMKEINQRYNNKDDQRALGDQASLLRLIKVEA